MSERDQTDVRSTAMTKTAYPCRRRIAEADRDTGPVHGGPLLDMAWALKPAADTGDDCLIHARCVYDALVQANDELRAQQDAIERVRAVHTRMEDGGCSCGWAYPCETILAIRPAPAESAWEIIGVKPTGRIEVRSPGQVIPCGVGDVAARCQHIYEPTRGWRLDSGRFTCTRCGNQTTGDRGGRA